MVKAQGGNPDAPLPKAKENSVITAEETGVISAMNALQVGTAAWRLGAGRERQGEKVQAGAGIEIHAKPGESIKAGAPLFTLHSDEPLRFERAKTALIGAVTYNKNTERLPLIVTRVD
jgi:thymidine phosphorylase